MRDDPETRPQAAWLLAVAALVLVSPLRALWAHDHAPWWAPFVPWALLVAAGLALARRERPR